VHTSKIVPVKGEILLDQSRLSWTGLGSVGPVQVTVHRSICKPTSCVKVNLFRALFFHSGGAILKMRLALGHFLEIGPKERREARDF
jgi:hypothetical protein